LKGENEQSEREKTGVVTQLSVLERLKNPHPDRGWTLGSFAETHGSSVLEADFERAGLLLLLERDHRVNYEINPNQ
jgi:hypothetical protein